MIITDVATQAEAAPRIPALGTRYRLRAMFETAAIPMTNVMMCCFPLTISAYDSGVLIDSLISKKLRICAALEASMYFDPYNICRTSLLKKKTRLNAGIATSIYDLT